MPELISDLVAGYASMTAKSVSLRCIVGTHMPAQMLVDPLRVRQVLANGLTNALKLTTVGSVTLQASVKVVRGQRMLLCQVMDTGPGLNGTSFRKLFDPTGEGGTCQDSTCNSIAILSYSDSVGTPAAFLKISRLPLKEHNQWPYCGVQYCVHTSAKTYS